MYKVASLTVDALRKWGINFSTSDKLKYTFLMTKHEEVNDRIVIFRSSYVCCLNIVSISGCIQILCFFFLNKITLGCFAFCFFSEEQTAGAESVDPQPAPWHASSGRDMPECRTQ